MESPSLSQGSTFSSGASAQPGGANPSESSNSFSARSVSSRLGSRPPDDVQIPLDMSLKTRFFEAFASRPQPAATQILQPIVDPEGDSLRELLVTRTSLDLTAAEIRTEVEGYLWALTPEAFLYFLPAFMSASLKAYDSISVFVSELIDALTLPTRTDVEVALDRVTQTSSNLGLSGPITDQLRQQQLEWFDSGTPSAIFHERFDTLTSTEGSAVLIFLITLQENHGADFPFGELQIAIDRYWCRYQTM